MTRTALDALRPLVFCVMPYGVRTHAETGLRFDFDQVYAQVIAPAAEAAGCQVIRSDHEALGGMIHTSMFERLLLADVVVADISIPNPNVFYELGIRHATRPRATITMGCFTGSSVPFDVAPLRHLTYELDGGVPADVATLRDELARRIKTGTTERASVDSPLFSLVAGYPAIELSHEVSESYRDRVESVLTWRGALSQAVASGELAAVTRLVEECQGHAELVMDAVLAYRDLEAHDEMITLLGRHTTIAQSAPGIELTAFARNRRNQPGDRQIALGLLERLVERDGMTSERGSLAGRILKDAWLDARAAGEKQAGSLLLRAIEWYRDGLEADPRDPLPGVNLATLLACSGQDDELARVAPVVAFALARRGGLRAREYFDVAALCELSCASGHDDMARQAAVFALGRPHPSWARASTARNLQLLGEVRPLAGELAEAFQER